MIGLSELLFLMPLASESPVPPDVARDIFRELTEASHDGNILCLRVDRGDPAEEVLAALDAARVRAGSTCKYVVIDHHHSEVRTDDGQLGEDLVLSEYSLLQPGLASVNVWHRPGKWQGYGSTVHIEHGANGWHVKATVAYSVE